MRYIVFAVLASFCATSFADEYYDLGCYVGNMTREEYYANKNAADSNAVRVSPGYAAGTVWDTDFKVGDLVSSNDVADETFIITGESEFHYFKGSQRSDWGYPTKNMKTGLVWWLPSRRLSLVAKRKEVPVVQVASEKHEPVQPKVVPVPGCDCECCKCKLCACALAGSKEVVSDDKPVKKKTKKARRKHTDNYYEAGRQAFDPKLPGKVSCPYPNGSPEYGQYMSGYHDVYNAWLESRPPTTYPIQR